MSFFNDSRNYLLQISFIIKCVITHQSCIVSVQRGESYPSNDGYQYNFCLRISNYKSDVLIEVFKQPFTKN